MKALEKNLVRFISDRQLMVLRDKRGTALNVSYTEDGLKWTTTMVGRLPYYTDAVLVSGRMVGDLTPSQNVYVETFVPYDHLNPAGQVAEYAAIKKATHLLYGSPAESDRRAYTGDLLATKKSNYGRKEESRLVYSTSDDSSSPGPSSDKSIQRYNSEQLAEQASESQ